MGGGMLSEAAKAALIGSVRRRALRGSPAAKSMRTASIPVAAGISAQGVRKGDRMPRVVFGAAPSLKEAKEATEELKDALDKVFLSSPKITEHGGLTAAEKGSRLSLLSNPETEADSLVIARTSVPQHAYQAFEMLSRSAEAQNVVASIVSDPNVWNAMMENPVLKQFRESQNTLNRGQYESASDSEEEVEEEFYSSQSYGWKRVFNDLVDKVQLTYKTSVFNYLVGKVQLTYKTIVSNLSTFIPSIFYFEPPVDDNGTSRTVIFDFEPPVDYNGTSRTVIASRFMGLAVMVVMVVLMKRA